MSKVYVKTDANGNIIAINSDDFLADLTGWTQIAEGDGDKFMHAQGNYFPALLDTGVPLYKLDKGKAVLRKVADVGADKPKPEDGKQVKDKAAYALLTTDRDRVAFLAERAGFK